jgi:tellurite methyltransferase
MDSSITTKPFWESAYQIPTGSAFGKPSVEIVALAERLQSNAAVLDLGCGEGRNALFLAGRGFEVTAVDISQHGISKLRLLASQSNLKLRAEVADMRSYQLSGEFDLIISHGCLHLIQRAAWLQVLQRIKQHTRAGGYNVVAVFTDRLAPPPDLEAFCFGLFREGELFTLYEDWRIESQQSYTIYDEHPGNIRHTHPINKLLARKPA